MRSQYMTGAKRVVAIGASSAVGVRDDDRPATPVPGSTQWGGFAEKFSGGGG